MKKQHYREPRIRTIEQVYEEIKKSDPQSCVTMRGLRRILNENRVPSVKIGTKTWLNIDRMFDYLGAICYNQDDESDITYSSSANEEIK